MAVHEWAVVDLMSVFISKLMINLVFVRSVHELQTCWRSEVFQED
jgi:hypothetical protein